MFKNKYLDLMLNSNEVKLILNNQLSLLLRPLEPQPTTVADWEQDLLKCPYGEAGDLIYSNHLLLIINKVRVLQLWNISEEEAQDTGVKPWFEADLRPDGELRSEPSQAYRAGMIDEWSATHEEYRTYSPKERNPWVWAINICLNTP